LFRKALGAASSLEPEDSTVAPGKIRIAMSGLGRSGWRRSNAAKSAEGKARHQIFQKYRGRSVSRDGIITTSKFDYPNRTIVGLTR